MRSPLIFVGLFVVILVIGILLFAPLGGRPALLKFNRERPYQAVFLTNGQVYFGHFAPPSLFQTYGRLTDIYYIQLKGGIQPPEPGKQLTLENLELAKLGQEIHGPKDEMLIAKNQILFWETLKDDSPVVRSIKAAKSGTALPPSPPTPPPQKEEKPKT